MLLIHGSRGWAFESLRARSRPIPGITGLDYVESLAIVPLGHVSILADGPLPRTRSPLAATGTPNSRTARQRGMIQTIPELTVLRPAGDTPGDSRGVHPRTPTHSDERSRQAGQRS